MTDEATGVELLAKWANEQGHWIRGVVAEVLETRKGLSDTRIKVFYEMMLREKELVDGAVSEVPLLEGVAGSADQEEPLVLTQLSDLENVNALVAEQTIDFNRGMTVLYGENGVGKTGYVRVLKSVASVRTREEIQPDIESAADVGPPKGKLGYQVGAAKPESLPWEGEVGVPPFNRMDVFDSASVEIHVEGPLTYVYTPSEVAVFKQSNNAIKAVKELLDSDAKARKPKGNPFLARFSTDGSLRNKVETLGEATDVPELEKHAELPEGVDDERQALEARVEALRSGTSDARLQVVKSDKSLLMRVGNALKAFDEFDANKYGEGRAAVARAEEELRVATEEGLAAFPIPGFQGDLWKAFVEAADAYVQAEMAGDYPAPGQNCAYCLQPLEQSAVKLLENYREFVCGNQRKALTNARIELGGSAKAVDDLELDKLLEDLQAKVTEAEKVESTFVLSAEFLPAMVAARTVVMARGDFDEALVAGLSTLLSAVKSRLVELESLAAVLAGEVGKRKQLLTEAATELRELKDRIVLKELLPEMRHHVESAKWATRAKAIVRRTTTILTSLTNEMKVAGRRLIYKEFERTFKEESESLKAPTVTLNFAGDDGEPARSKSVAPAIGLRAILSEGEQKVIALADFLAEATLRQSASPMVFDDPVTSLDYRRMKYVVERLVGLSRERQVIVFTHNVWFTMMLLSHFEKDKESCTYYDITEAGDKRGRVWLGTSPKLDTWDDRRKRLNKTIERAEAEADYDMRKVFVEKGFEGLRGACEIVAETTMLCSVVQSYRPNVMVDKLREINVDALSATRDRVCDIFDDCCRFLDSHKQPIETLNVSAKLEDLKTQWKELQELRARHKKK